MASLISRSAGRPSNRSVLTAGAAIAAGLLVSSKWKSVASVFGVRTEESPHYLTEFREMDFKVRHYAAHAVAEITVQGEHDAAVNEAFHALAEFIFGKNSEKLKMSMTAPVGQTKVADGWQLSFILPSRFDLAALPKPTDERIRVFAVPPRRAAVVSFKGKAKEEEFAHEAARLQNWMRSHGLLKKSEPILNLYDPPFTLPFLKKNEVLIEIAPSVTVSPA